MQTFRKIFTIDRVEKGKPDPDLYNLAALELGYKSGEYLAIEDSINGVKSARLAGLQVWGFVGGRHATKLLGDNLLGAGAVRLICSAEELEAVLVASQ